MGVTHIKQAIEINNQNSWQVVASFMQRHNQNDLLFFGKPQDIEQQLRLKFVKGGIWRFADIDSTHKIIRIYDEKSNLVDDKQKFDAIFLGESVTQGDCINWLPQFAYSRLKDNGYVMGIVNHNSAIGRLRRLIAGRWYDQQEQGKVFLSEQEIQQVFVDSKFAQIQSLPISRALSCRELELIEVIQNSFCGDSVADFSIEKFIVLAARDDQPQLLLQFQREIVFCLQRLDHNIQITDSLEAIAMAFSGEIISNEKLIKIIDDLMINPISVKIMVASKAADSGYTECALKLFMSAYQQDSQNEDVIYNFALLLKVIKETALAKTIIQNSHSSRSDVKALLNELNEVYANE